MQASLTALLSRAQQGDRYAENLAANLAMDRLRMMARSLMGFERADHTLRATALVNELFLQKLRGLRTPILNREHFYSIAAAAMRQVLIDHARGRSASKRRVPPAAVADLLMASSSTAIDAETRFSVREALRQLAGVDSRAAAAIRCRFMEGRTIQETALLLKRSVKQVRDDSAYGLTWMADKL